MGCGQSKINLYPRRNKNSGKGNGAKKSGATEKETDEEEGAGQAAGAAGDEAAEDRSKHILPLTAHPPPIEVSASQQDFFKMLDDKIDKGKDYDSSSETELQQEYDRRRRLIQQWRSASQSTQSSLSQPSPPTPARRRPRPPDCQYSPRRCYKQHPEYSPPLHRANSAQHNGDREWHDPKSPIKRPQSAGGHWKTNTKVQPYQKPKSLDANENKHDEQDYSQITYNPTYQTHSPVHKGTPQPYVAHIISYPTSQQVTPSSPPKYIAPPEEYQDPQNNIHETSQRQSPVNSQIYYIHGNSNSTPPQDIVQQRQQTAIHLQQYVAMKQAQQQMITYLQRGPHTVFPNVEYTPRPGVYEDDGYVQPYNQMRPISAPTPVGVVRPMPISQDGVPMWSHKHTWVPGQVSEGQYFPHFMQYRPHSAGSAGTLTRYKERPDCANAPLCQSLTMVRQKQVGQICTGPELTVCPNLPSVSSEPPPARQFPNVPPSDACAVLEVKNKKNSVPFNRHMKSKSLDST